MPIINRKQQHSVVRFLFVHTADASEAFNKVILTAEQQLEARPAIAEEQEVKFAASNKNSKAFIDASRHLFENAIDTDKTAGEFEVLLNDWHQFFIGHDVNIDALVLRMKTAISDFLKEQTDVASMESPHVFDQNQMAEEAALKKMGETLERIADKLKCSKDELRKKSQEAIDLFRKKENEMCRSVIETQYGFSKASDESNDAYDARIKLKVDALSEKKEEALMRAVESFFLNEYKKDLDVLVIFSRRLLIALDAYKSETDITSRTAKETFKQAVQDAVDACVAHYQKTVEPSVLDYIKAAGLALVGTLIGILTFPGLVFSTYREQLSVTFFSGVVAKVVDTPESDMIRDEMKACDL